MKHARIQPVANRRCTRPGRRARTGLSLIELVVGGLVGAVIAAAVATSLYNLFGARRAADERRNAYVAARVAVDRVARDLATIVRDEDLTFSTVRVIDSGEADLPTDELLLLCSSTEPVRGIDGVPEGDRFEVQYRLSSDGRLLRRRDPAFDQYIDGGGVVSTVAEHIRSISIEAADAESWYPDWDSDRDGLPHGVRVTVAATLADGGEVIARRLVAIDRVPIPIDETAATEEEDAAAQPGGTTPTPDATGDTGGTTGGGGGAGGGGGRPRPGRPGGGGGDGGGGGNPGGPGGGNPGGGAGGGPGGGAGGGGTPNGGGRPTRGGGGSTGGGTGGGGTRGGGGGGGAAGGGGR